MEWVHVYILAIAIAAIVLLVLETVPMSMVGIGMIIAMAAWPGLIDGRTAIQGFANPAVITVGALFVVGEGFVRTGAASILADKVLHRTGGSELTILLLIMVMAAILSAFVNNTLVVVTFLPVITTICRDTGVSPSRLLIPLSYASILGGMCTLVGTSTNILVDGVLKESGRPGLTMFEMAPGGIILAGCGVLYLAFVGRRILPDTPSLAAQAGAEDIREFVTEVTVGAGSPLIGVPIGEFGAAAEGTRPVMLVRNEQLHLPPFGNMSVEEGDNVMIRGGVQGLTAIQRAEGSRSSDQDVDRYDPRTMTFFELALTPASGMVGHRVGDLHLKEDHGAAIAGVLRGGQHLRERYSDLRLGHGDVLLAFGDDRSRAAIRRSNDFHLIEGIDRSVYNTQRASAAVVILAAVMMMFVTGIVDIPIAALIGAFSMIVTGCLSVKQAHHAINWAILAFIAGALALSAAMGASKFNLLVGNAVNDLLGAYGPMVILAGLFVTTVVLTEILTNNAVAIILTPIAIKIAAASGIDERPLVMVVVFGASCCFANPLGYQTNLLVFGPGGYRFKDYLKIGLPMDLLLVGVGITIIPWFWPV